MSKKIFQAIQLSLFLACVAGVVRAAEKDELRIGYQQGNSSTLPMIAKEFGYFDQYGVKVDFTPFSSTSDGLAAMQANKLDLGVSFGTCAPLTFLAKGAKFVIIGGNLSGGHPVVTLPENAALYRTIEDFRGKKVGSPRIFTSDVVFRGALLQAGIDQNKDLEIVEFKRPTDLLEAVKTGKIDVAIGTTNLIGRALAKGLALPMWTNDFFPNHPCCRIVATEQAVKTKRAALVAYLKAELLAEKRFHDDPESGVIADIHQQKFSEQMARELVTEKHSVLSVDPNRKGIIAMWEYMKEIGYATGEIDFNVAIDTNLYAEALKQLRTAEPDEPYWKQLEEQYRLQNQ